MKSYLSLIPISAKVHKRQNRLTLLCIIFAVFLVTTIFSLADMSVRQEKSQMLEKHGNWHIKVLNLTENEAQEIQSRSDVEATSWYGVLNKEVNEEYYIQGKRSVLYGVEKDYITTIWDGVSEGCFPESETDIMLTPNAKDSLGVKIGDPITVSTPGGDMEFHISGFGKDDDQFDNQTYVVNGYMNRIAFAKLSSLNPNEDQDLQFYIQFKPQASVSKTIRDIKQQYRLADNSVVENNGLLAMSGGSSNKTIQSFYSIAIILFLLILIAGVLMIAGSINSNVAQRTKFFGMMRCIGASKKQIKRFVLYEALNWCKAAIPIGVILGTCVTWGLCAVLRFGIGGEFANMPLCVFSIIGIGSGVVVGIVTVLLAAQSPAKKAAKASPVAAVSGSMNTTTEHNATKMHFFKIDSALGIHHAVTAKKNLFLMTGSIALSILLFLVFCTGLDLVHALVPSLRSWQPDVTIIGFENACNVDKSLVKEIQQMSGVKDVYGITYAGKVSAVVDDKTIRINLVSYDDYMFECSKGSRISGDLTKAPGDSDQVLTIYNKDNSLRVGDKLQIGEEQLEVGGALSDGLFADGITIICSEETFTRLMGEKEYAMVCVQLKKNATDADLSAISALAGENNIFTDMRENNRQGISTYWAFRICAYSFLAIIALITILNIINSTSMSVTAKIKQYGVMRAVGMECKQLTKVIAAEVMTYTVCGCMVGGLLGLLSNKLLYEIVITKHFGTAWTLPVNQIVIILLIIIITSMAAIYGPSKRIRNMNITNTINEL